MKIPGNHNYYVYIVTNPNKTTLYVGVTNDLKGRVNQHFLAAGDPETFAGKYFCYNLVYYEWFRNINEAIAREKQLKGWRREKKEWLINRVNPDWMFVNEPFYEDRWSEVCGNELW